MKTAFPILTHQTVYNYDVLNRIKSMNGYYRTGTETALTPSEYNSTYSYDANGNIVSMTNFAKADDGTKKQMDAFSYNYLANTNQLLSVDDDNLLTNNFSGDVDDQQTSNYGFDEIGQLIKDEAEKIEQITWTVTNKVKEVIYKGDLQGKKIRFDYDAMGHRIAKHVTSITGDVSSTYYVLDAQGNAMSTYTLTTKSESTFANKLVLSERNIYGSKRLGIEQLSKIVAEPRIVFTDVPWEQEGPWDFPWGNAPWEPIRWSRYYEDWSWTRNQPTVTIHAYKQEIGDKRYELANHLGNVLNVVTDRKLPVEDANDNTKIAYFTADVVSFADYLPFGMTMPGRSYNSADYDYGFNGKRNDNEIKGIGNSVDFDARIYDPRIGKFLSVDPMAHEREWVSPYNFVQNNPINRVDPTGALDDWYESETGEIKWDKDVNSQKDLNKKGSPKGTYLGKELTFTFNSYIGPNYDGPLGSFPEGDKLTSTIKVESNEDKEGNLVSVNVKSSVKMGATFGVFEGRDYFPGLGGNQNKSISLNNVKNFSATFEQHASVPYFEELGLNSMGFDIVNVAQKATFSLSNNKLSVTAATDIFPSATLSVNGLQLFRYIQPSFTGTHGTKTIGYREPLNKLNDGLIPIVKHLRPAPNFYTRFKK